jgi:hypothetical protein
MKRVLSLLVASLMIVGMLTSGFVGTMSVNADENGDVRDVTMIVGRWNRCGYDRYGRPLLNGRATDYEGVDVNLNTGRFDEEAGLTGTPTYDAQEGVFFPWQYEDDDMWGTSNNQMPNCMNAYVDTGEGLINQGVDQSADDNWSVLPYLYCEVFLTVDADGGDSQLYDKRHIVMDEIGQVWIDPDGKFHDCRYWEPADPTSDFYRSNSIFSSDGTTRWNDCDTNPRMVVDPSGDNNTQGPYIFNPNYNQGGLAYPVPNYHERIHYWWWDEEEGIDRVWQLGIADQTDYLREGAYAPDGFHTSSGLVGGPDGITPNAYYPGKPVLWNTQTSDSDMTRWTPNDSNILAYDWDHGLALSNFSTGVFLIDVDGNGTYTYGEPIFSDANNSGTFDNLDLRLNTYTIEWGGESFSFTKGTLVGLIDQDYNWQLANNYALLDMNLLSINDQIRHTSSAGTNLYDQVYFDADDDGEVSIGDIRLTNINGRINGMGASCGGFYMGDAIIMLETLRTSCSYKYNIHVESDLWSGVMQKDTYEPVEMYPSMTAAQFHSPNGDIVAMAQNLNKATALDVNGRSFYMPVTTFYNVALLYREYIGLQLFLDNGIDNNRAQGGECYQLSLADDHVNFKAGELFVGCQDVETAMDWDFNLTEFNDDYLYYETSWDWTSLPTPGSVDMDNFDFGCGEPFYRDINKEPAILGLPFQPNPFDSTITTPFNPGLVNEGDQRMVDMEVYSEPPTGPTDAGTKITYPAGSYVVAGDLDYGRPIITMPPGLSFYDEPVGCWEPNGLYDEGELIYWDPSLAAGFDTTYMFAWDTEGVHPYGIEDFNDSDFGAGLYRWSPDRHGGNAEGLYNRGENNMGAGAFGISGYTDGSTLTNPPAEATVQSAGRDWFYQQAGALSRQSPYTYNPHTHNAGQVYSYSSGYVYDYSSWSYYPYGYMRYYSYTRECGDLLAIECDDHPDLTNDDKLKLYEDTTVTSSYYLRNYTYQYNVPGTYYARYYGYGYHFPYSWGSYHNITLPVPGGRNAWRLYDYSYYDSQISTALMWYRGLDSDGDDVCTNDGPGLWNQYQFNYDLIIEDHRDSPSYEKRVGMGCVYMDHDGAGFGQMYYYSGYNRSYYGWHNSGGWSAMHFLRFTPDLAHDFGTPIASGAGTGRYSVVEHFEMLNPMMSGDLLVEDTVYDVDSYVFGGQWHIETDFWPADMDIALTGGNIEGAVGFYHANYYNYNKNRYGIDVYFDNATAYHIEQIPSAGNRLRLKKGGHHVGMNKYVYKLNDTAGVENYETSSANSNGDSALTPFSYWYPCGTRLAAGEIYDIKSKVSMVSMGRCGDPRFMDIPVLPGKVDLNVKIDGVPVTEDDEFHLKVEQTSDIQVSVDPPPQPGEKYVVKLNGVYQEGIPAREPYTDYIQTLEANTFTEYCDGLVPEYALDKDEFTSTWLNGYCYTDEISLPFAFPLYDHVFPAGSPLYITPVGYLGFNIPPVNQHPRMGYTPYTYYWFGYRYGTAYRDYTICPLGTYQHCYYAPSSGITPNDNLQIFYCQPDPSQLRVRWATRSSYPYDENSPADLNFAATLYDDGSVRFSYGDCADGYYWRDAVVGISGDISGSDNHDQYIEGFYHGLRVYALDYRDDLVFNRFEFPADPGRASGGTVDDNYFIGNPTAPPHALEVGGAEYSILELTPENPLEHIQYTPYRGSVQEDGSCDPLTIEVFLERGGVTYPVPTDSVLSGLREERPLEEYEDEDYNLYEYNIYDPYWVLRPWDQAMYEGKYPGDHTPRPVPSTSGMITADCSLDNQYDCYGSFDMIVEPEWIDIEYAGKTCISPVDQRFPNLVLSVFDADNDYDINDPAGMKFSTVALQAGVRGKMIANVNAHGAGIKYLCTAMSPDEPNERYIIQVNEDGTYTFWRWWEEIGNGPGGAVGALDPTDWLYSARVNIGAIGDTGGRYSYASSQPFTDTDGWLQAITGDSNITTELDDHDCSFEKSICKDVCHIGSGFPNLGSVNRGDMIGRFNNSYVNSEPPFFQGWTNPGRFGAIETYGIPTMITNWDENTDGGEIYVPVQPRNTSTDLYIRVYLANTIFDYNSTISSWSFDDTHPTYHPPYFIFDDSPGIDYCGTFKVDVQPAEVMNFSEFEFIDHGLQFSQADYTSGTDALSEMQRPTRQIRHWYDPICDNYREDCRAYTGGQSHCARAIGSLRGGGFNSYPALYYELYNKLGTEFYPFTDYGIFFTLVSPTKSLNGCDWDKYAFEPVSGDSWLKIQKIEVSGPFMYPERYIRPNIIGASSNDTGYIEKRLVSEFRHRAVENVPLRYNTSGYLKIDARNFEYYELRPDNWTNVVNPGFRDDTHQELGARLPSNAALKQSRALVYRHSNIYHNPPASTYGGGQEVLIIDELIPIQPGNIEIKVTLADGTVKIFQDCCVKPITDGIDVHALGIELENDDVNESGGVTVGEETLLKARITEDEKVENIEGYDEWEHRECNDAVVFAWQDCGILDLDQGVWTGPGDGWVTGTPKNSDVYAQGIQFMPEDDFNDDGFITFDDHETEIMGSYHLASNTWTGAFIDARTFQRNGGLYKLTVNPDMVGFDFGGYGPTGEPLPMGYRDHVVSADETLPIWINAYKYGDDDGDRSFRPLYDSIDGAIGSMSHEVYLAGTKKLEVFPRETLNMTYGPEPITAGMTPELQNPDTPLHFTFTDNAGEPVDFTKGIEDAFGNRHVKDRDIWTHCFNDPHPDNQYYYGVNAVLPQYYWTRLDLHNYDSSTVCNSLLYGDPQFPFRPIGFAVERDEAGEATGRYEFTGFVANDQGEFEVYAYTPDRLQRAKVAVKVVQPEVKYAITNLETTETFDDIDFIMTANDDRTYKVKATCWDAQGSLIKGIATDVSVCSGSGSDTARFTPYITRPQNFNYQVCGNTEIGNIFANYGVAGYGLGDDIINWVQTYYMMSEGLRYYPFIGIDRNNDGEIDPMYSNVSEMNRFCSMRVYVNYMYMGRVDGWWYTNFPDPLVHYNTTNWRYDDNSYEVENSWDLPPANNRGWGWGAIYNQPYEGGYVFADLDMDSALTFADSLSFNQNGSVEFYYWPDDVCDLGGLVGNNELSNDGEHADVIGFPGWYDEFDPNYMDKRYFARMGPLGTYYGTMDHTFRLDWEALSNRNARVEAPTVKLFNPETGEEASTELLDPEAYDATYAQRNHFIARVYPADERDGMIKPGGWLELERYQDWRYRDANLYEHWIKGKLVESVDDPKAMETIIYWKPTGTGENTAQLSINRELSMNERVNKIGTEEETGLRYDNSFDNHTRCAVLFDVIEGLKVTATPYNEILKLGQPDSVLVKVENVGSESDVEGAKVTFISEDGNIEMEGTTDAAGEVTFENVTPETRSKIYVTASLDDKLQGKTVLFVDIDLTPPSIDVDDFEAITNKSTINLTGTISVGATLMVEKKDAKVGADGKWESQINLEEGENLITLLATGANGVESAVVVRVTLDTIPPQILMPQQADIDAFNVYGESGKIYLMGRITPGSQIQKITVSQGGDDVPVANVYITNDVWKSDRFEIDTGEKFTVTVEAIDVAGNTNTGGPTEYFIKRVTVIDLGLFDSVPVFNGEPENTIQPPELDEATNTVMVPLTDIADMIDGINAATQGNTMTVTAGNMTANCILNTMNATVNGNPYTLSVAPYMVGAKMMVPIDFVQKVIELIGNKVTVERNDTRITITIEG